MRRRYLTLAGTALAGPAGCTAPGSDGPAGEDPGGPTDPTDPPTGTGRPTGVPVSIETYGYDGAPDLDVVDAAFAQRAVGPYYLRNRDCEPVAVDVSVTVDGELVYQRPPSGSAAAGSVVRHDAALAEAGTHRVAVEADGARTTASVRLDETAAEPRGVLVDVPGDGTVAGRVLGPCGEPRRGGPPDVGQSERPGRASRSDRPRRRPGRR